MNKPTTEDILGAMLWNKKDDNPIISGCLEAWCDGRYTWELCLLEICVRLAEENKKLKEKINEI